MQYSEIFVSDQYQQLSENGQLNGQILVGSRIILTSNEKYLDMNFLRWILLIP
jgi:hypothetical protein